MMTSTLSELNNAGLCARSLRRKRHEIECHPIFLGSVFSCFKADMTTVEFHGLQQIAPARNLHDHAATSLSRVFIRNFFKGPFLDIPPKGQKAT